MTPCSAGPCLKADSRAEVIHADNNFEGYEVDIRVAAWHRASLRTAAETRLDAIGSKTLATAAAATLVCGAHVPLAAIQRLVEEDM